MKPNVPGSATPPPPPPPPPSGGGSGGSFSVEGGGRREGLRGIPFTVLALVAVGLSFYGMYRREAVLWGFGASLYREFGGYARLQGGGPPELWRLFSTLFVPRTALGAGLFVLIFGQLGGQLERLLGSVRLGVLFLVAGGGGLALAEWVNPGVRTGGPMIAAFSLLGAIPAVVWGVTRSLRATLGDPSARSAVFWVGFSLVLGYLISGRSSRVAWDYTTTITGCGLGFALGGPLALSLRRRWLGGLLAVPGLVVGLGAGWALSEGVSWSGVREWFPEVWEEAPIEPLAPPSGVGPQGDPLSAARPEARGLLQPFGALVVGARGGPPVLDPYVREDAEEVLATLEVDQRKASGLDGVALEPWIVRLRLLLGDVKGASRLAAEHQILQPSPESACLSAACLIAGGEYQRAYEYLDNARATGGDPLAEGLPEVYYFLGLCSTRLGKARRARPDFERFLELTEGSQAVHLAPLRAQAELELQ